MDQSKHCVARFRFGASGPFLLTIVNGGGHVESSEGGILGPEQIDCGATCHAIFAAGSVVTLDAIGSDFTGWSGDCSGSAPQTAVTMDRSKTCRAHFQRFALTMVVEGEGTVTSAPAGIHCPVMACVGLYPPGTTVELTAHPTSTSMIASWLDDCAAPGVFTNLIVMESDKRCRVRFVPRPEVVRALFSFTPAMPRVGEVVTFDGNAGCVLDPTTNICARAKITSWAWDFDEDGVFEVSGGRSAAAIAQYAFQAPGAYPVRLRVEGGQFFGRDNLVMVVPVPGQFTLSVNVVGNGRVVSNPVGIDCGADCGESYDGGTSVTLTATPNAGFRVGSWLGCDTFNGNRCTVVMGANRAVRVTFTPLPS